jgi:hypothetical protein
MMEKAVVLDEVGFFTTAAPSNKPRRSARMIARAVNEPMGDAPGGKYLGG